MSGKSKTVLKGFKYMACDDFAKYLSDMAAKGWHFKEWGVGLKFEKGEPQQVIYAVEVFQKASENDMRPEPNTQEFAEYCESAGWKLVDSKQKYCIFKKIDENAVDLYTPEERVANAFKGTFSGSALLVFFLYGVNALLQWGRLFESFESTVFSATFFFNFSIWNVMFFGQLIAFLQALWMKGKLKRDIRFGREVHIGMRKDGKFRLDWNDIYIALLILLLMYYFVAIDRIELVVMNAVVVVGTLGFSILLNKFRPEHDTNVVIQIGFTVVLFVTILASVLIIESGDKTDAKVKKQNLPLQISDYRETEDTVSDVSYHYERNIFGSMETYFIYGKKEIIYYYVYRSPYSKILDKVWDEIIGSRDYNEDAVDCTEQWNAIKALRNVAGAYYVRYDNVILEFAEDTEAYLTEEQIEIITEKLELR